MRLTNQLFLLAVTPMVTNLLVIMLMFALLKLTVLQFTIVMLIGAVNGLATGVSIKMLRGK